MDSSAHTAKRFTGHVEVGSQIADRYPVYQLRLIRKKEGISFFGGQHADILGLPMPYSKIFIGQNSADYIKFNEVPIQMFEIPICDIEELGIF